MDAEWAGIQEVGARVVVPQRLPYGLHGKRFAEGEMEGQREMVRVRMRGDSELEWWKLGAWVP